LLLLSVQRLKILYDKEVNFTLQFCECGVLVSIGMRGKTAGLNAVVYRGLIASGVECK